MLSLLSLIIASGTVLRADTEQWEPTTYPDPRTNATQCNTVEDSTLCDPDRILTDTWRQAIHNNIVAQTNRLQNADIKYTENATEECREGSLTGIRIFVILARRINTTFSQNITSNDLTNFGHGIREAFGLDMLPCKNYILVLAVELAKEIYVWTGSDLALPEGRMETSLEQYKNLFLERNYMQGLNKLVDEIGNVLADPYKGMPISKSENETMFNSTVDSYSEGVTASSKETTSAPFWVFTIIFVSVSAAVISLMMLVVLLLKWNMAHDVNSYTVKNEKPGYMSMNRFLRTESASALQPPKATYELENISQLGISGSSTTNQPSASISRHGKCSVSATSLPSSLNGSGHNSFLYNTHNMFNQREVILSSDDLFADKLEIRCVSALESRPSKPQEHKWASF